MIPSEGGSRKRRKKITPEQFARNQLAKAGIKPGSGDVKAQFRKLNKAAAKRRTKAGRPGGSALKSGYSSALAAEGAKKKSPAKKSSSKAVARGAKLYRPGRGK